MNYTDHKSNKNILVFLFHWVVRKDDTWKPLRLPIKYVYRSIQTYNRKRPFAEYFFLKGLQSTHDPTERTKSVNGWAGNKPKARIESAYDGLFSDSKH